MSRRIPAPGKQRNSHQNSFGLKIILKVIRHHQNMVCGSEGHWREKLGVQRYVSTRQQHWRIPLLCRNHTFKQQGLSEKICWRCANDYSVQCLDKRYKRTLYPPASFSVKATDVPPTVNKSTCICTLQNNLNKIFTRDWCWRSIKFYWLFIYYWI